MNKYELSETNAKYSLNLSFGGKQERPALQKFYSLLEDLDKHLVKEVLNLLNFGSRRSILLSKL